MPVTTTENMDAGDLAVLVLDDDDINRRLSAEIFANKHVRVVQAATKSEAERELISHPGIDALSLDVSLRGGGHDRDGAELAVIVRQIRPELPIIGYSAHFAEAELTAEERDAFTVYFHRGGSTQDIRDYVERCLDEGQRYRRHRRQVFDEQLSELERSGQLAEREYEVLRSFSPADGEDLSIERALTAAGYQVSVILPAPPKGGSHLPRRPLVVWVRQVIDTGEYEAEVFGQPSLYGVGATSEEAIHHLVEVFWMFAEQLRGTSPEELQGPALSLAHFFEHVLSD